MYFFHFVLVGAVHDDSKRSQKRYENSCLQIGFFRFNSCKMPGNLWCLKCMKKNDIIEKNEDFKVKDWIASHLTTGTSDHETLDHGLLTSSRSHDI